MGDGHLPLLILSTVLKATWVWLSPNLDSSFCILKYLWVALGLKQPICPL